MYDNGGVYRHFVVCLRHVGKRVEFGLVLRADEHICDEMGLPGNLHDEAHLHAGVFVGAAETVDDMLDEVVERGQKDPENSKFDENGYYKYKLPWNLNVSYSVSYGDYLFNKETLEFEQRLSQTLNFSGGFNFTDNWTFTFSSGYDFVNKEMSYTSCSLGRRLHCWSATLSFIPFGANQGFNFHIGVNSSMLSDLKYEKRTSSGDYPNWY